jgi:hypothetical protein
MPGCNEGMNKRIKFRARRLAALYSRLVLVLREGITCFRKMRERPGSLIDMDGIWQDKGITV